MFPKEVEKIISKFPQLSSAGHFRAIYWTIFRFLKNCPVVVDKISIQVAYSVAEEKAYEREFGAFAKLDNSCQKIVITNDDIDFSTSTVRHIQFREFVQKEEL